VAVRKRSGIGGTVAKKRRKPAIKKTRVAVSFDIPAKELAELQAESLLNMVSDSFGRYGDKKVTNVKIEEVK
jgi:hypothetical protein